MTLHQLTLEKVSATLGWPDVSSLIEPVGAGPAHFARLVQTKVGRELGRSAKDGFRRIGVLVADPDSAQTDPPFALVAEFGARVSAQTLRELHRLAWNFSHAPTLITIEPDVVKVWSCCEAPSDDMLVDSFVVHTVSAAQFSDDHHARLENGAVRALHWINLVSGKFFADLADRFNRDGRADQTLLTNLRFIREKLLRSGLTDDDVCHDLLARVIFVQFLFDRKDSDGTAALNPDKLKLLFNEGVLSSIYRRFTDILHHYDDCYRLFEWLNDKFNGDLFPGKGDTTEERAAGWMAEQTQVKPHHLVILADFIGGEIDLPTGQASLWPQYSFDVIPLEFISSIYETFVVERAAKDGIFYTPPHLVDFVLDRVLPWDDVHWDIRVLDPACGSGIFLVKSFQRLIHRWRFATGQQVISAKLLRRMLERNLIGVDKDPHAVRVACFSLYLAMCDEIEPRHYWTQVRFPSMRDRQLICSDFFIEGDGFDSNNPSNRFDLIVGNAPWGKDLVTEAAIEWAKAPAHRWPIANKDIGSLFLAKGAMLLAPSGQLALIQSAGSLLFNTSRNATSFRQQLFRTHTVEAIYNLSALRFKVFKRKNHTTTVSSSPSCIVVLRAPKPEANGHFVAYVSPKTLPTVVDDFAIVIEAENYRWISSIDASTDPFIWTAMMWGTRRDLDLLRRLSAFPTLDTAKANGSAITREGIIFGDRTRRLSAMAEWRLFDAKAFPKTPLTHMLANDLPLAGDLRVHSRDSTNFEAFNLPQMIVKQGWQLEARRFQARMVYSTDGQGVLCNQSYVSVHGSEELLRAACLVYNSILATYFLQLSSGRMAAYRPEVAVADLLKVPLPNRAVDIALATSQADIDRQIFDAFGLKDAERALIEDMVNITMADLRSEYDRPGQKPADDSVLETYCAYFTRVLKAGFGKSKGIRSSIFVPPANERFAYRLVAFELIDADDTAIRHLPMEAAELLMRFEALSVAGSTDYRSILRQRTARIYESGEYPTIYILKPDAVRYWTRSTALNEADEVAIEFFSWMRAATESKALA
ncbi:N-6 DNA methylase [Rhizobium sp. FKY42]|uniref:HsdM family class I SAM-dependent methyltransferase n=1 Tax=Rhizobium sp. FKY42 TaxID=2562310 RepID=UPI0010C0FCD6|nr:N-6 DNA methylase [Rhizobium sp. FKY42]